MAPASRSGVRSAGSKCRAELSDVHASLFMIKIEIVNAEIWSFRQFPGSKRQIFFEIKKHNLLPRLMLSLLVDEHY